MLYIVKTKYRYIREEDWQEKSRKRAFINEISLKNNLGHPQRSVPRRSVFFSITMLYSDLINQIFLVRNNENR